MRIKQSSAPKSPKGDLRILCLIEDSLKFGVPNPLQGAGGNKG